MSERTIRRAAEHKARKAAAKSLRQAPTQPDEAAVISELPIPESDLVEHTAPKQSRADANRANSLLSTGPTSEAGKAISSQNRRYHGLAGAFTVMPWENHDEFLALQTDLRTEYQPATIVEQSYVDRLAEHMWLRQRCLILQSDCFSPESHFIHQEKQFSLLLRYQTSNERSFDKCVNQLLKLRAARSKGEVGFESQNHQAAAETRKKEAHEARLRLTNARTKTIEVDADIRQTCEAAIPGHMRIPFELLSGMFRLAIGDVSRQLQVSEART